MSRVRQSYCTEVGDSESEDNVDNEQVSFLNDNVGPSKLRVVSALRRVSTKQSPYFKAFYKHFPLELTLDTGAEVSMIKASSADYIGVTIKKSNHSALQADGVTPLNIVGECHFTLSRDGIELQLEALVVNDLDVDILAGIPFMSSNDIAIFPSKHKIVIRDKVTVMYGSPNEELNSSNTRVRRTQAFLIRAPSASSVVWPGCYGEYDIPSEIESDCILAVEPHTDASRTKDWPSPQIAQSVAGKIRIVNNTSVPQFIQRNEHFCRVRLTTTIDNAPEAPDNIRDIKTTNYIDSTHTSQFFKQVSVDPDNLLSPDLQTQFNELLRKFSEVFSPNFEGYNGEIGPFEASVNMGPVQPPQRKGRMPQYSKNNLVELQNKFDELECKGVFRKPEDVGISVEYINPSFLVKKASGGFRLVTAFADVGRYSKPQPSLMPDVDSASPRVTSFLSVVSRYQVSVNHLSGRANIPSDFASRNAPVCTEPNCQVCCFISRTEDSVVRAVSIQDVLNDEFRLPFTTRSAWINIQSECPDLRRTHAHLKQGTRPSKKLTNIKDVKRYLNVASIAKDGLLVVRRCDPLAPPNELIIVPRNVLDGLVTALHIKLDHPSKHQLNLVLKRHFYALDMPKAAEQASDSCHTCASLKRFPKSLVEQSSEDPPDLVGISYVADVLKRNRQLILVVRETVTSYTSTCFIKDEKLGSLRDGLIHLLIPLKPLNGPSVVVRVDPAPGFRPLCDDSYLKQLNISIEIGRVKNRNKNPVADKAIAELEDELLREEHDHSPLSENTLVIATTRLNSRLRQRGLSSRELWTQRSQFTHEQLPISDMNLIRAQHEARNKNHGFSENSKCSRPGRPTPDINIGDLVYLYTDRSKTQSRDRYLVVARDGEWCFIKKFSGNQLRASSYKVKLSECYKVLNTISAQQNPRYSQNVYNEESDSDGHDEDSLPGPIRDLPPERAEPPPILICENIDDVENLDEPTAQHDNSLEHDLTLSNSSTEQDNKRVLRKRSELKTPARFKDFISF
ncbi:unnamed protein product [Mytilus edulis]|uniref:Uncharacterized protein n=1 Tax=Mytilus edulis TaxID=6550 RepID=A0A8S3TRV8_MYTED|nr:unnamed protein product [Mytilus edulis]